MSHLPLNEIARFFRFHLILKKPNYQNEGVEPPRSRAVWRQPAKVAPACTVLYGGALLLSGDVTCDCGQRPEGSTLSDTEPSRSY